MGNPNQLGEGSPAPRRRGPSTLKSIAAAGVLTLAGGFANKAGAQTPDVFPLKDVNSSFPTLNKRENPRIIEVAYFGADNVAKAIDLEVSKEGDTVVLTDLGVRDVSFNETHLLINDGVGSQNELIAGVYDELGQRTDITLNGNDVWRDCDQYVDRLFPTKDGKVGLQLSGNFGTAGARYEDNVNSVVMPIDPNSDDWCADYNQMIAGQNPLTNGVSDRVLSTPMTDYTLVDGAIRLSDRGPSPSDNGMPSGLRVSARVGNNPIPQYFISGDNANSFVLDPNQVPGGNPVENFFPGRGVDMTGAQGLNNVVITLGLGDINDTESIQWDAHEKVVAADGTVTLVRRQVILRDGNGAPLDQDADGIVDEEDEFPGMNAPGGAVNRAAEVACHLDRAENRIGNNMIACDDPNVMARADGSRLFIDGHTTINLNGAGDVLTVSNVSNDVENPSHFEWHHAHDVSSGLPQQASPNITFGPVDANTAYRLRVNPLSLEGFDHQNHDVRVINAADILNGVAPVINATDPVEYNFAPGTIPVLALGGTVVAVDVSTEHVELPDAEVPPLPDQGPATPDAGQEADAPGAVDAAAREDLAPTPDEGVVVVVPDAEQQDLAQIPDEGVTDLARPDALVVDAASVADAAPMPEDRPIPVDQAPPAGDTGGAQQLPDAAPSMPPAADIGVPPADGAPTPVDVPSMPADVPAPAPDAPSSQPTDGRIAADVPAPASTPDEGVDPNAPERCNGLDDNGNGLVDEDVPTVEKEKSACDPSAMVRQECRGGHMVTVSPSCEMDPNEDKTDGLVAPPSAAIKPDAGREDADAAEVAAGGGNGGGCAKIAPGQGINGLPILGLPLILAAASRRGRRAENRGGRRSTDIQE